MDRLCLKLSVKSNGKVQQQTTNELMGRFCSFDPHLQPKFGLALRWLHAARFLGPHISNRMRGTGRLHVGTLLLFLLNWDSSFFRGHIHICARVHIP
jgi:hypothetical protein